MSQVSLPEVQIKDRVSLPGSLQKINLNKSLHLPGNQQVEQTAASPDGG
jgi:hypothetical protein